MECRLDRFLVAKIDAGSHRSRGPGERIFPCPLLASPAERMHQELGHQLAQRFPLVLLKPLEITEDGGVDVDRGSRHGR